MSTLVRVWADVRGEVIQDEHNPLARVLLADPFETSADLLFLLIFGEAHHTLAVERVGADRWFVVTNQRSGNVGIIDVVQSL